MTSRSSRRPSSRSVTPYSPPLFTTNGITRSEDISHTNLCDHYTSSSSSLITRRITRILTKRIDIKIVKEAAIKDGDSHLSLTATKTSSLSWQRIASTTGDNKTHTGNQKIPKRLKKLKEFKKLIAYKKTNSLLTHCDQHQLIKLARN